MVPSFQFPASGICLLETPHMAGSASSALAIKLALTLRTGDIMSMQILGNKAEPEPEVVDPIVASAVSPSFALF